MKKLFASFWLCYLSSNAFSQGTVSIANGTYSFARTNAVAIGGTAGNTSPVFGGFVYGLFTAPSTVTTIDSSLQDLLGPNWQFTGLYATNSNVPTGGRLRDGAAVAPAGAPAQGWLPGQTNSFIVVGWSTTVAGQDWPSVANQLRGATFHSGGVWSFGAWTGGGFSTNVNVGLGNMFLGTTTISFGMAGDPQNGLLAFPVFAPFPTIQGNGISSPFDLLVVVPEPGALNLISLGGAILLAYLCRASRQLKP